ncbi:MULTISPECIES: hypothetical protein [unclassified Streptomyces]|uniref:hypothetical protein n=1 Tax=unclassified Streptomyces TaxID=2593676 RepID=UPI0036FC2E34
MSGTTGTGLPGSRITLFAHALRLHAPAPDEPLPPDGEPYPDDALHRCRPRPEPPEDRSLAGKDVARILDAHFARPAAPSSALADAFHDVHVPIHPNENIAEAARRADPERARSTGRWLVRHGTDRCAVTVGLALLAAVGTGDDIPLIQTIGLLSNRFGPLAADALEHMPQGAEALLWLGERVSGWGRVYVVEALCRTSNPQVRTWLLRRACDGDFLNGYFAGRVATVTRLHEALDALDTDSEMVDHVGCLLHFMSDCDGMGLTLAHYPHSPKVLEAYVRHVAGLAPTLKRYFTVALLAQHLVVGSPEAAGCTTEQQRALRARYTEVLDQEEWTRKARTGLADEERRMLWLANHRAPQLKLRGFPDPRPAEE